MFEPLFISGTPGSGKSEVAALIAQLTGMKILSIDQIWRDEYNQISGCKPTFKEWQTQILAGEVFNTTKDACREGILRQMIIDGRYSHPHFFDGGVISIFVNAPLKNRAAKAKLTEAKKYSGKTEREIVEILGQKETDELRMGQLMFGADYDYRDPKFYHAVYNSGSLNATQIAHSVFQLIL